MFTSIHRRSQTEALGSRVNDSSASLKHARAAPGARTLGEPALGPVTANEEEENDCPAAAPSVMSSARGHMRARPLASAVP